MGRDAIMGQPRGSVAVPLILASRYKGLGPSVGVQLSAAVNDHKGQNM